MPTSNMLYRRGPIKDLGRVAVFLAAVLWLGWGGTAARAQSVPTHWIPAPLVKKIGPHLYAYVSDDDDSSNSTFLVRKTGILVVDTGLDRHEAGKLLKAIRKISRAPIRYVVNTHYHKDHQGGNGVIGPHAVIVSTARTRELLLQMMAGIEKAPAGKHPDFAFRPATLTVADQHNWQQALHSPSTVYLDGEPVVIYAPGPGHTLGDAVVYFPEEKAVATGDLFMNRSCPDMDKGSLENWVETLKGILALDADYYVPGHFNVGTRRQVLRFYDYMSTLSTQVQQLYSAGVPIDEVPARLHLAAFSDFRQFPGFDATFADNAKQAYRELQQADAAPPRTR